MKERSRNLCCRGSK